MYTCYYMPSHCTAHLQYILTMAIKIQLLLGDVFILSKHELLHAMRESV